MDQTFNELILPKNYTPISTIGGKRRTRKNRLRKSNKSRTRHNNTKNGYNKYKWISKGRCSSHKYKDLTRKDCNKYFPK
jgi:hypothetical protein